MNNFMGTDSRNINQPKQEFRVFECTACFALLPYLGAKHNCPDYNTEEDEGFEEETYFMNQFLAGLEGIKKNSAFSVRYIYAD